MHLQSAPGLCGIAVIRSVLETQFRIKTEENELIDLVAEFHRKRKPLNAAPKEIVQRLGTSPTAMAYCLKKKTNSPVKIFCSKKGSIAELQGLSKRGIFPMLHRLVRPPEFGLSKPEGHYVVFCGAENNTVKIFDPRIGLREYAEEEFNQLWQNDDEKWFMVVTLEQMKISRYGKYF